MIKKPFFHALCPCSSNKFKLKKLPATEFLKNLRSLLSTSFSENNWLPNELLLLIFNINSYINEIFNGSKFLINADSTKYLRWTWKDQFKIKPKIKAQPLRQPPECENVVFSSIFRFSSAYFAILMDKKLTLNLKKVPLQQCGKLRKIRKWTQKSLSGITRRFRKYCSRNNWRFYAMWIWNRNCYKS